jgi:MFS family permease
MRSIADALQSIAVTLWVGGLWIVGFVVAPLLFSRLGDRALAGLMAGKLFTVIAWIGVACAAWLIVFRLARYRAGCLKQGFFWAVVLMLLLALAGQFGVQPVMEALRAQALPKEVMESVLRDRFMTWHGVASALYVIQGLLGLALVVLHGKGR